MILAAYLTLSVAHAALVWRILARLRAPALIYVLVIPMWLVAWPLKSLNALWSSA